MGNRKNLRLPVIFVGALAGLASAQAQTAHQTQPQAENSATRSPLTPLNQAIDRVIAREHDEMATFRRYNPIIETYIQDLKPDKEIGAVPVHDHYFLGQASLAKGVIYTPMLAHKRGRLDQLNPLSHLGGSLTSSYVPDGFLQMIYVDMNGFDRQHYQFDFVGREFLGDVSCVVLDVTPRPKSGNGRFKGRIWAEDQNLTIVRFNGVYTPVVQIKGLNLRFDSWRLNLEPGLWLPAFVFSQELDLKDFLGKQVRYKSQTRLWGYDLKSARHLEEFSDLTIESPDAIEYQAGALDQDRSPIEAEREWQHQAETNILDRLQRTGLLAPPGEVDEVLETMVKNLEATNNLDVEPAVDCRVLLTATLESFSIGHTIVLSRGLLDVLPDEATLAAMLADELANIIMTRASMDQWGFNDTTNVTTVEARSHFTLRDNPDQEQVASQKAVDLLKNSPYKEKLGNAGRFLKQLDAESKSLRALINPRLGKRALLYTQLINSAPQLQADKLDQIAALPIGTRIELDPWSDDVELTKAKPVPLLSAREAVPFEVTSFIPYLTRYHKPAPFADSAKADLVSQKQQPQ
jgi:hypothetical protein